MNSLVSMRVTKRICCLGACLLWACGLIAQDASSGTDEDIVSIRFQLYLVSMQGGVSDQYEQYEIPEFHYWDGVRAHRYKPKEGALSPKIFEYKGPRDGLKFFSSVQAMESGGRPMATTDLEFAWKRMVFILIPTGRDKFKIIAVENTAAKIPDGTLRVYNLIEDELVLQANGRKARLSSFKSHDFRGIKSPNDNLDIQAAAQKKNGRWDIAFSSTVPFESKSRQLMLLYRRHHSSRQILSQTIVLPLP